MRRNSKQEVLRVFMLLGLLRKISHLKEIYFNFLHAEHMSMEVIAKQIPKGTIFTTNDWTNFIATCQRKETVHDKKRACKIFLAFYI